MGAARETRTAGQAGDQAADERYRRIFAAVAQIPRGRVASYGQVAQRAGLPRRARLVGRALASCPARLPWHRVLGAGGRICLAEASPERAEQIRRLRAEGVEILAGRVKPEHFAWQADDLDALLWGPQEAGRPQPRFRS